MAAETKEILNPPQLSADTQIIHGDISLPDARITAQGNVAIGQSTTSNTTNINVIASTSEQVESVLKAEQNMKREEKETVVEKEKERSKKIFLNTLPQPLQEAILRSNFIHQLAQGFCAQAQKDVAPIQVIYGMGGVGKTQLAINYANQHKQAKDLVVWIHADASQLQSQWLAFGGKLSGRNLKGIPHVGQLSEIRHVLCQHENWLIILDNLENQAALGGLLPQRLLPTQQLLITTRSAHWNNCSVLALPSFTLEESQTYFEKRLASQQCKGIEVLAEELGHLPLAMAHAAAYMQQTHKTVEDYLKLYREKGIALLAKEEIKSEADEAHYSATVLTTYQLSITELTHKNPQAAVLLTSCAYFHPDGIQRSFLEKLLNGDEEVLDECIRLIRSYSFLSENKTGFSMHRIVQQAIRYSLTTAEQQKHITHVARCLTELNPKEEGDPSNEQHWRSFMPHLETIIAHYKQCNQEDEQLAIALEQLGGLYLHSFGQPEKSRDCLERAFIIQEALYGKEHYPIASLLANLGCAYGDLGDMAQKRDYLVRALDLQEKRYGRNHYQTATILMNLGNAYGNLGNPIVSKDCLERALDIQRKRYGQEHHEVANILANLANIYGELGDVMKKRDCLERALPIQEKYYGPDHGRVAATLANLSSAYAELGETIKQRDLLERALAIQEKRFGSGHYRVAAILVNLGVANSDLGATEAALNNLKRALAIQEAHYEPDHYEIAVTLVNLGNIYRNLENLVEAQNCLERALIIEEKHYGVNHYKIASTLGSLGSLYAAAGYAVEGRDYLVRTLKIQEAHYGKNYYQVATTLVNLGIASNSLKDFASSQSYLERALNISQKHYGSNHPHLAILFTYLAVAYIGLQQPVAALETARRAYHILIHHPSLNPGYAKKCLSILQSDCQFSLEDLQGAAVSSVDPVSTVNNRGNQWMKLYGVGIAAAAVGLWATDRRRAATHLLAVGVVTSVVSTVAGGRAK